MTRDTSFALLILILLVLVITQRGFTGHILEFLLSLTRPGATFLILGSLLYTYHIGHHYTFLAVAILSVFLLKDIWSIWPESDARRLHHDIAKDQSRFDPRLSLDIQVANKVVGHDAPSMLRTDSDVSHHLIFPPSAETLATLNGE
jgi:hypothetical protein